MGDLETDFGAYEWTYLNTWSLQDFFAEITTELHRWWIQLGAERRYLSNS